MNCYSCKKTFFSSSTLLIPRPMTVKVMVMKPAKLYLHTLMRYIMINISITSRSRREIKVP